MKQALLFMKHALLMLGYFEEREFGTVWEIEQDAESKGQFPFKTVEERSFLRFGARQIGARGVGQLSHRCFEDRRFNNRECSPGADRDDTGIVDAQLPRD